MTTGTEDSRRKRNRCLLCIAAGIIAQTIIIVLFVVFVLRVKTPKVRLDSVAVDSLATNSSSSSPSFKVEINAVVAVKNNNFGHYKFESSKATFSYKGTDVGEGTIAKEKAKAKKTKRINVVVSLSSNKVSSHSELSSDLRSGNLTLTAYAKLDGKVHLLNVLKKKKSADMNCTINLDTKAKMVRVLTCK
ncbi:hypothetical protein D8674_032193 [Pyrus ussuriensis x Pyrus communis]|uniref:Late embryogenesis abundant protein LEA-2 subgroup domain-containing protein n=1 Tax=Pyrus ussuriensis x Pyrus communis TaxID=2448454 RepID=A0A5N5F1X9_9ROSA|nr:hypothetical protein D8674_032193 [Pyrus ussuriensis x Pyrus communis]